MNMSNNKIKDMIWWLITRLPPLAPLYYTRHTQTPITIRVLSVWQLDIIYSTVWRIHLYYFLQTFQSSALYI